MTCAASLRWDGRTNGRARPDRLPLGAHLLREYVAHCHEERPHERCGNLPLGGAGPDPGGGEVLCRERVGGLLKHYNRRAA